MKYLLERLRYSQLNNSDNKTLFLTSQNKNEIFFNVIKSN